MSMEQIAVHTIKGLGMDAIQKANSGHPGMVMGMADIATVLWGEFVEYDPDDAGWWNRDRVVLSNGHGSMLLYAILHLTQQSITLDDIKNFRQWGSITAGHPEYGYAPGIETTTGPLGQGFANAVGMAMAQRWLADNYGAELNQHQTYVLCGDGCLMEGISAEAASLAGHLGLENLIALYDDNNITIDGQTSLAFGENVAGRFQAYGWNTISIDGHDREAIRTALHSAKFSKNGKPTLLLCKTVIAKDAPTKAGKSSSHGSPLGAEEIRGAKIAMGMDPDLQFATPTEAYAYFAQRHSALREKRAQWNALVEGAAMRDAYKALWGQVSVDSIPFPVFDTNKPMATRIAGGLVMQAIANAMPNFIGGSADLASSNKTKIPGGDFTKNGFAGARNIHFGVREHGMAGICNGLQLHGGLQTFCATFLVFHDYMRPSVRLSALMHLPVIYVYTHDSIFVGEDGPTHQPIEHLASMRLIPNLWVLRPAEANETSVMWKVGLARKDGPVAICLTRQDLPVLDASLAQNAQYGGYIVKDFAEQSDKKRVILVATGSEVSLAMESISVLEQQGVDVRVVSMPCVELFHTQSAAYKNSVLPQHIPVVSVEAGVTKSWQGFGVQGSVGIDRFGASAPGEIVAEKLSLHVNRIVDTVQIAISV